MTPTDPPTLADDEATLQRYAGQLGDAIEKIARSWLARLVDQAGGAVVADIGVDLDREAATTVADLRALLAKDIAHQPVGPLELLRRSVRTPTAILQAAGVPTPQRDEFVMRNFPDDIYDLTPASFGDVDPSLHEPGLVWGAAKAHVHLRRRREADAVAPVDSASEASSPSTAGDEPVVEALSVVALSVVALSADLIDRSKISAAYPEAKLVRSVTALVEQATGAALVLVDLSRLDDAETLTELDGRIIAFGSHVDDTALAAAEAAGAEALPRSVFFRRLEQRDL